MSRPIALTLLPDDLMPGGGVGAKGAAKLLPAVYDGADGTKTVMYACPGCGHYGAFSIIPPGSDAPRGWRLDGELGDPRTWILTPSIIFSGCCKWHGYLRAGIWEPC